MRASFAELRKLADWLDAASRSLPASPSMPLGIERLIGRLGRSCAPLLARALRDGEATRREAARAALAHLASEPELRERVIGELRAIADDAACADEVKVCALGLLSELGEKSEAKFRDPGAIQRRSALALAAQLGTAAEVASAADLMLSQLADNDIVEMLEVMSDVAAGAAGRLAAELSGRLDAHAELLVRVAPIAALHAADAKAVPARRERPTHASVLVDAAARLVVVASRKVSGEKRWRRWAVLIGATGRIDDCIHSDDAGEGGETAPLIAQLVADGYRVASTETDHARAIVSAAARLSGAEGELAASYYLGRDLLDLADAHLDGRARVHVGASMLARAIDLVAAGQHARALALLARCDASQPAVAAALAACASAQGRWDDAAAHLERAIAADPELPLHHWNLAAALYAAGDGDAAYRALRGFLAASAVSTGLDADDAQASRVAQARRFVTSFERRARATKRLVDQP